jgi:peroxiredoxin
MANITLQETKFTLQEFTRTRTVAPDFTLVAEDLSEKTLSILLVKK